MTSCDVQQADSECVDGSESDDNKDADDALCQVKAWLTFMNAICVVQILLILGIELLDALIKKVICEKAV
jgi:hypothetical protein